MRKISTYILILSMFVLFASVIVYKPSSRNVNPKKESEILETVLSIIKTRHIVLKKFDDDFSKKMFKSYLDSLDRNKIFLLQSDIEEFKKFETKLDDHLKDNDLTFFFMTFDRIKLRMQEGQEIYNAILKNDLDFSNNIESEYIGRMTSKEVDKLKFCKNKKELEKRWENFLKTVLFERIKLSVKNNKVGASNSDEIKSIIQKDAKILNTFIIGTIFDYDNLSREMIFQHFINSILVQFDNYSKYFNPVSRNEYIIRQTGKIVGVGVSLQLTNNNLQIVKLTEGGPGWKSKKLELGDAVIKIAQNKESAVNVVGFNPFEAAKLLKGDAGTLVTLTIKKANGKTEDVVLKRALVAMNDTYLKSAIIKKNKTTYGLISFPRFYNDMDDEKARNAADDFEQEIAILKREGAKALVIDMRNNRGGNFETSVNIVGNFLTKSPVAQFKSREENITTVTSEKLKRNWDKNVVLLVSKRTASEAELIVSAFKEHNIGIVVGEQTKGNGTTQEYYNLNEFKSNKIESYDLGAIIFSGKKFYNLKGKSIQKIGVKPDVDVFDDNIEEQDDKPTAESEEDVKPVVFLPNNKNDFFATAIKNSKQRLSKSENVKIIKQNAAAAGTINQSLIGIRTLNLDKFTKQLGEIYKTNQIITTPKVDESVVFTLTPEGAKLIKNKEYLIDKRNKWLEYLSSDFQVQESLNILEEVVFAK